MELNKTCRQNYLDKELSRYTTNLDSSINEFVYKGIKLKNIIAVEGSKSCDCKAEIHIDVTPKMTQNLQNQEGKEIVLKAFKKKYNLSYSIDASKESPLVKDSFDKNDLVYTMCYYIIFKSGT